MVEVEASDRNSPGTFSGRPKTNSTAEACAEGRPSQTHGRRFIQLPSTSVVLTLPFLGPIQFNTSTCERDFMTSEQFLGQIRCSNECDVEN